MLATVDTAPTINAADHVRLAYSIARRFLPRAVARGIDSADLESEAMVALVKSAQGFDPSQNCTFATYACKGIEFALIDALNSRRYRQMQPLPLDPITQEPADIEDHRSQENDSVEQKDSAAWVRSFLRYLRPQPRRIIELRFGLADGEPRSLAQVGAALGISKTRVREIETRSLDHLRRIVAGHEAADVTAEADGVSAAANSESNGTVSCAG